MTDNADGPDWDAGLDVLTRWAHTGRPFTANVVRPELRALGFTRYDSGALFQAAQAQGIIVRLAGAYTPSTDKPTHGALVRTWIGTGDRQAAERVTVPVQRNREGRFTTGDAQQWDVPLPIFGTSA